MKYIKKFQDNTSLETYKKSNFVAPHIYLDSNLNTVKFMQEYQQLEYISSTQTGGQYIDLGCKLLENTDDIRIDIKFNVTNHGKTGVQQSSLITSQPEVNPYPGFVVRLAALNINDSRQSVSLMTKWMCSKDWITYNDGKTRYCCQYMAPYSNSGSVVNGGQATSVQQIHEYSILIDNIPSSQINNFNCHLFCALNSSNEPFRFIAADIYYLKFTKGGQVIRNLIPVKKVSTNEIGLYDIENDHLYVSQGNDPFVVGPNK